MLAVETFMIDSSLLLNRDSNFHAMVAHRIGIPIKGGLRDAARQQAGAGRGGRDGSLGNAGRRDARRSAADA
jgi:hypothetical protein